MEATSSPAENLPVYCVIQHESKRQQLPITLETVRQAQDCKYDMLTTPITTPSFHHRVRTLLSAHFLDLNLGHDATTPTVSSLSATDTSITPSEAVSQLVGVASTWVDLSSPDPIIHNISRQVLELEISYASFCGLANVVVPGPKLQYGCSHGEGVVQYAYAIQELLALSNYTQISIHLPMMYHPDQDREDVEDSLSLFMRPEYVEAGGKSRQDCLALSIPRHHPAIHAQSRWHSEPLRLLSLTAQTFLPKPDGDLHLTRTTQALIHQYMRLRTPPWILLCDVGPIPALSNPEATVPHANGFISANVSNDAESHSPTPAEVTQKDHHISRTSTKYKGPTPHLSCIRKLQQKSPMKSIIEQFGAWYQDYLQGPLQPLSDNLESMTYEVFEKDPVKYDLYESAIRRALSGWASEKRSGSSPSGNIVVAVVGAGRGPLVTRALRASKDAGTKIELWAVEKNPNAFVFLQRHNELSWSSQVHLVQSDMRSWDGPFSSTSTQASQPYHSHHPHAKSHHQPSSTPRHHKVDILISELLGSFADNELSPECLDHLTTHHLNRTDGISIPASYTSYLTPIAAPKLHADIASRTPNDPTAPNTPYVVMLHAIDFLSTSPNEIDTVARREPIIKEAWSFTHRPPISINKDDDIPSANLWMKLRGATTKNHNDNKHNTRSTRLTFPIPHRGCVHGLAGYFEAVLYDNIHLSTNPKTMELKSPDMMSWFPIYFPLKTPLYMPDNSLLTATFRRCTDGRKVWYEWMVETYLDGYDAASCDDNRNRESGDRSVVKGEMKNKKRVRLGVSEVGSSRGSACVM
ncbi:MAG: hypothetical protein Q9178_005929 [Gyalolechia marmorata]